jgi:hypothetical protein
MIKFDDYKYIFQQMSKIDRIKKTDSLKDCVEVLKVIMKSERGLSIQEIEDQARMSGSRIRPYIFMLNLLNVIIIKEKIGNTVLYESGEDTEQFYKLLEVFIENE